MSEPHHQREWRFYVDDMIAFADKVLAYTDGLDQTGFVASGLVYDATLRNLELLGEAATRISDDVRGANWPGRRWMGFGFQGEIGRQRPAGKRGQLSNCAGAVGMANERGRAPLVAYF